MKKWAGIGLGVLLVAAIPAIYAFIIGWYFAADPPTLLAARQLIGTATITAAAFFVIGELLGVERQGYYLVAGGAIFFLADLVMWGGLGIRLGVRAKDDGLIPLSLIGVFLGPLFRLVTMTTPSRPHNP